MSPSANAVCCSRNARGSRKKSVGCAGSGSRASASHCHDAKAQALNHDDGHLAGLRVLAARRHIDQVQAVLAWLLARAPTIVAISGTTKVTTWKMEHVGAPRIARAVAPGSKCVHANRRSPSTTRTI